MILRLLALLSVGCLCMAGCGQKTKPETGEAEGLEISLPEFDVNVNEEDGIEVKTPGTDVKVDADGIDVTAPGTDVKVNEEGLDVQASE